MLLAWTLLHCILMSYIEQRCISLNSTRHYTLNRLWKNELHELRAVQLFKRFLKFKISRNLRVFFRQISIPKNSEFTKKWFFPSLTLKWTEIHCHCWWYNACHQETVSTSPRQEEPTLPSMDSPLQASYSPFYISSQHWLYSENIVQPIPCRVSSPQPHHRPLSEMKH